MKTLPRIGVTTGTTKDWQPGADSYDKYAGAVIRAGGQPVRLGPDAKSRLEHYDGLLVTGGNDVHPRYYVGRPGDETLSIDELKEKYSMHFDEPRDDYELSMVLRVIKSGIPVFGICRGFQLINVVFGGSLVPDIQVCIGDKVKHKSGKDGIAAHHDVEIDQQTKLGKLLPGPILHVNSYHHQGIMPEDLASNLRASAVAADGLVEAFEAIDHPWLVAVQWHPEKTVDTYINEACFPLFDEFVRVAASCER